MSCLILTSCKLFKLSTSNLSIIFGENVQVLAKIEMDLSIWMRAINNSKHRHAIRLTSSWRRPLSYRNQSIDLRSKSMDWFLYDNGPRHERVKIWRFGFYFSNQVGNCRKSQNLFLWLHIKESSLLYCCKFLVIVITGIV